MAFTGVGFITVAVAVAAIIGIVSAPRRRKLVLSVALVAAATLAVPAVGAESTTSDDVPNFVTPPQRPTEVTIGAYLIGLSRVSEPSAAFPTVEVEVFVQLAWKDPRLAFESGSAEVHSFQEEEAEEKLSEIWSPDLEIQNEVEQRHSESIQLTIHRDGTVAYEERFGATLNAEIDLRRFPFDDQIFELEFQSFVWDKGDSVLVADPEETGFDADFETPEWWVTSVDASVSQSAEIRDDTAFSTYTFRVHASRRAGHYVLRFMLPLAFVMALTWSAFWMPVDARPRVGFIALLTVVASHTVITGDLPRLHYPTFADILLFVCYVFATTLIVVSIVVQRIDDGGAPERARSIESRTRWLLPVITALSLGGFALVLWS